MLLGARLTDPNDGTEVDMADSRIKVGVLLAAPGRGGADLSTFAAETTDENPERLAEVQRLTWAYLRTAFYPAWSAACATLMDTPNPLGRIECR